MYGEHMTSDVLALATEEPVAGQPTAETLAAQAWRLIRSIGSSPETVAAEHDLMRETGLTAGPLRALRFLPLTGSLPMRQLAARMGCDNSYVTPLVDTLEKRGLAAREPHPTDRRIKVIVLTERGRQVAGQAQRVYDTPPSAFSALSDTEAASLCDLLRKLRADK
jgi:DNA-binding MarR family transcriptional regulator